MVGSKLPESERRAAILTSALDLALENGLDSITVRKVAERAEISAGLVFHHFGSKDGLLSGLLALVLERTLDADEAPITAEITGSQRLLAMLAVEIDGLREQAPMAELIFMFYFARTDDFFREPIRVALARYREAFRPASDQGARELDLDPGDLSMLVVALIEGVTVQSIRVPDEFDADGLIKSLKRLLAGAVPPQR